MRRLAWAQLRFRTARPVALLLGMLMAATALTVLAAATLMPALTVRRLPAAQLLAEE